MSKKQNKVQFASGFAWFIDKFGNRKSVDSLEEAMNKNAECCGLDCCENVFRMQAIDVDGVTKYPVEFSFTVSGTDLILSARVDLGEGWVSKEVTFS